LGVPQLGGYLNGEVELEKAVEKTKTETRRYAKRQLTWIKRNMIAWNHINAQQMEKNSENILSFM
jgi:tRNA dimethylallyltransferase